MNILLDTPVLLGLIGGQTDPLISIAKNVLESKTSRAVASVASLWEISIRWRLGKLPLHVRPEGLPVLIEGIGFELLPIGASHATASVEPDPTTRDSFDRLLLAQCKVEGLRLLTTDRALASHPLALQPS